MLVILFYCKLTSASLSYSPVSCLFSKLNILNKILALLIRPNKCPWQFLSVKPSLFCQKYLQNWGFSLLSTCLHSHSTAYLPSIALSPFSIFQSSVLPLHPGYADRCAHTGRLWLRETECDGGDGVGGVNKFRLQVPGIRNQNRSLSGEI